MKTSYISLALEIQKSSNDIIATSSVVETGRISFGGSTYSFRQLSFNENTVNEENYNTIQ